MGATAWEEIEHARSQEFTDEDGSHVELAVAPPLSDSEVKEITERVGVGLPAELVELLHRCRGLDGVLEQVDFSGATLAGFGLEGVFPHPLPIAHDGFGNCWVLDLTPETAAVAPVYFACHDPPVVLFQSPDLAYFTRELIRMLVPPHESAIDDIHEGRLFQVWRKNPGTMLRAEVLGSSDSELRAFAAALDDRFTVVDLRDTKVGMGFSWGRHGSKTIVRRHGNLPLFAYAAPESRGLWSRLTGRG